MPPEELSQPQAHPQDRSRPQSASVMWQQPIAVTGVAVLTPLGDSVDSLSDALNAGRRSVAPATATDAGLSDVTESRIADFDATRYANVRGMRIYNRTTRLGISVARLALSDAGIPDVAAAGLLPEDLGLIMASTFGHLDTLVEYDRSLVADGIQRTNPALMPLGLPSSPGAAVALSFSAKAFSITLADDAASSLDALGLAARLLASGRARVCLVVGAFAPFAALSLAARRAGILATGDGAFRVFDRRHCGTAFGEAAAALVLERREDAQARGIAAKGFIKGQASAFATATSGQSQAALQRACATALTLAGSAAERIALISAGANGSAAADSAEARALIDVLGSSALRVPLTAVKASLGDSLDAGGLVQAVVALAALRARKAPPIAGLEEPAIPGLRYLHEACSLDGGGDALVTSTSSTGACSALILGGDHVP